jgi:hypothetical protein|tara:strand:- start:2925 stop:3548 length:624 start_codon:yes stop_codon:yes gene_type:complete
METLKVVNPELLDILHEWMDFYDEHSFDNDLPLDERRFGDRGMEYYTSEEYLKEVQSKGLDHKGPPEFAKVCDFHNTHGVNKELMRKSLSTCAELSAWLCAKFNAVHVYYPAGGFMAWHNNWDVPGYNILMSHSEGTGFFRHVKDGKVETITDPVGWNIKIGYYGGKEEPYWHTAGSTGPRQTFGFVIPHKGLWEDMIKDITTINVV